MGIDIPQDYRSAPGLVALSHKMGKRVGLVRGTFDVFHEGHLDFLIRSKELCDVLIANVNNNLWYMAHKGAGKMPYRDEIKRATLVAMQDPVDYAFIHPAHFDMHPAIALTIRCKPDVPDRLIREDKDSEFQELERRVLFKHLGYVPEIKVLPRSKYTVSSSEIVSKILETHKKETIEDVLDKMGILYSTEQLEKILKEL